MDLKDLTLTNDLRIFTLSYEDHPFVAAVVGPNDCNRSGLFEFKKTRLAIWPCIL
jgi:hypothetical protein